MKSMPSRSIALLGIVSCVALVANVAQAAPVSTTVTAIVPRARGLTDAGRAPGVMPMQLAFTLNYRKDAELDAMLNNFADPSSPLFGKYLTPEQFRNYFSPTEADYQRTIALLESAGFTVTQKYANRTVIDAVAPAAAVERLFATEIHRVAQSGQGLRYANARPATMPAALRGFVSGVTGFNNLQLLHFHNKVANRRALGSSSAAITPDIIGLKLRGPDVGYGPIAIAQGYNMGVQHGFDGRGHTAGIVIGGDPSDRDLATFLSTFQIVRSGRTTRVPVDGGPGTDLGDRLEATLDYETIASLAPGANIIIYEPNQIPFAQIVDSYNRAVSDARVETLNSSFGSCEAQEPAFAMQTEQIAKQGAAIGIVFHASTGDSGSNGDQCTVAAGVDTPASGPSFVAVGGTSLSVDTGGNYFAETTWMGGGGGVSTLFARPAYQSGIANVIARGRNIPDLSFDANPDQGMSFFFGGSFQGPIGGTSLSTAIFGAMVVELNQMHNNKIAGFNAAAYRAFGAKGYHAGTTVFWNDVIFGNNGFFTAHPGYDQATGIGSPNAENLAGLLP